MLSRNSAVAVRYLMSMQHASGHAPSERRADIDYLRVGALLLLIVYHTLLVYSDEWWRVESSHQGAWADYIVNALTPWRMALVFVIGGMAARYMIERARPGAFVLERATKLLTAFVFAVIVLIPIQRFVRLDNDHAPAMNYLAFLWTRGRHAVDDHGVWLPDFANAWFLPYLFVYSVIAAALWTYAPRLVAHAQRAIDAAPIWILAAASMGWYALVESAVIPQHPVSGLLIPDPGAHMRFLPAFAFGFLIAKSSAFTAKTLSAKVAIWLTTLALLLATMVMELNLTVHGLGASTRVEWNIVHGLFGGAMLFSVLGFGFWALNKPTPALTWASDAILPVYLMHQTVLVVVADAIVDERLPLAVEFPTLIVTTLLVPVAIYMAFVRRTSWLRVLFGLRPHARPMPTDHTDTPAPTTAPAHRH